MRRRKFIKVSAVGLAVGAGAAPGILREAVPLPDVKEAPAAAPRLEPEALGVAVRGVLATDASTLVPNPDGRTYDVLQWYYEDYSGPTWLYAIDLGSGQVKRQRFPDKRSIHLAGAALGPDGKYYLVTPYHYYGAVREAARLGAPTGMELFVYDPATNTLEARGVIVPGLHGERRPLTLGPDGKLYGVGSYSKEGRVGVYAYDPRTHQVRDYGPVGPAHKGGVWADWGLSVDETHVYTLSGFTPYYLVAVDIATGADTVLLETQAGGEMRLRSGLSVEVIETHGAKPRTYWLHRGTAVAKTSETRPWPVPKAPQPASPPKPELHTGEVRPDAAGRARLWYRPARAAAGAAPPADGGWQAIVLEGIETYPLRVKLLAGLPDGRIFCKAEGHYGGSVFDPRLGRFTETGYCRTEDYACLAHAGKVYWTGYPSGEVWVYDPNRPWTHARGVPPGGQAVDKRSAASNPRSLGDFHAQRVSQMLSAAVGADGKLYLCGWGVRAYKGGAFCWVDLKTEARGGLWQP
ncbi:MAG: hypothetical protein FJ280_26780, partial [Planctomycetes bacterium]|nr:hypothetical protein [Planctomycetota bacterium]